MLESGVGHHDIETPEPLERGIHCRFVALPGGEIRFMGIARPAEVRLDIDGEHAEAIVHQPPGDGPSDAAARPRHNGCLPGPVAHRSLSHQKRLPTRSLTVELMAILA